MSSTRRVPLANGSDVRTFRDLADLLVALGWVECRTMVFPSGVLLEAPGVAYSFSLEHADREKMFRDATHACWPLIASTLDCPLEDVPLLMQGGGSEGIAACLGAARLEGRLL